MVWNDNEIEHMNGGRITEKQPSFVWTCEFWKHYQMNVLDNQQCMVPYCISRVTDVNTVIKRQAHKHSDTRRKLKYPWKFWAVHTLDIYDSHPCVWRHGAQTKSELRAVRLTRKQLENHLVHYMVIFMLLVHSVVLHTHGTRLKHMQHDVNVTRP